MRLLILDFMVRKWWVFVGIAAFATLSASVGALYVFTPLMMIAMMFDQQQGWVRAVNGLPLSRRTQGTALWFIGVLLPTFAATLGLLVGALIFHLTHGPQMIALPNAPVYTLVSDPKYFAPLYEVAVGASFGLGYAALCFLIVFVFPNRVQGKFVLACLALFMPLAQFGPMFMSFILPKNPGMMVTWHWVTIASVPILALLSWLASPWVLSYRIAGSRNTKNESRPKHSPRLSAGFTGMQLFVADSLIIYALAVPLRILALEGLWMLYRSEIQLTSHLSTTSVIMFTVTCFSRQRNHDLRILRSLPLSTSRLALLQMLGPLTCGFCHALGVTALCRSEFATTTPILLFLTLFFSMAGGCALAASNWGQFAMWKSVLATLACIVLIFLGAAGYHPYISPFVLPAGAAALMLSFRLFKRGLGRTEVYHSQRRFTEATIARVG